MTKIKDKEYKAIEAFIEHTKKILVTKKSNSSQNGKKIFATEFTEHTEKS